jgi:hypothetical protein
VGGWIDLLTSVLSKSAQVFKPCVSLAARLCLAMATSELWYKKFKETLSKASKMDSACVYCSTGTCLTQFGDCAAEGQMRKWHREWSLISRGEQDIHLLWMFYAGSGNCVELLPGACASSRIDTSSVADDSSIDGDGRIPTSSDDGDSSAEESDEESRPEPPSKKPRRQYSSGQPRRSACTFVFLGRTVCRMAALRLMRVGADRLERVRDGRLDGRRDAPHAPGKMSTSVWRFLWKLYHTVGEGMPDKFSFQKNDANTLTLGACKSLKRKAPGILPIQDEDIDVEETTPNNSHDQDDDDQMRAIAGHAMYVVSQENPVDSVLVGPGIFRGPLRFLPPSKRLHLYWEYRAWAKNANMPAASFSTFLRAFGQCSGVLRIRKSGSHAVCSTCKAYKKQLGKARFPQDRQRILELYTAHVVNQWLDRQVYGNAMSVSLECRRLLASGELMLNLAVSTSSVCMAVDGMDQAKFRLPRVHITSKALDTLIRPALHVQGAWAHGFGYHMAIMDADMKHDTNNNVEVISRMLEQIFVTHKGLPLGLHLQQDNTSRECKNQKILKWAIKLVSLGVFRWVTLNYLTIGHTHDNLDGTFGQITVRLSMWEFDDDEDVVDILMKLLADLGIEKTSRRASLAYKLDEAFDWETWWNDITIQFSNLTGPRAPHSFRVCCRKDLGRSSDDRSERDARTEPLPGNHPAQGGDVVVAVKHYMHSKAVSQVFTAWPEDRSNLGRQPAGFHPRRPTREADGKKVISKAIELYRQGQISAKARDYLVDWTKGRRKRRPRPERYEFLEHSFKNSRFRPRGRPAPLGEVLQVQVQGIAVGGARPEPLPDGAESGDDQDDGELVIEAR